VGSLPVGNGDHNCDRSRPMIHHLTLKVTDLAKARAFYAAALAPLGYEVLAVLRCRYKVTPKPVAVAATLAGKHTYRRHTQRTSR
jgi:hypothetical protein